MVGFTVTPISRLRFDQRTEGILYSLWQDLGASIGRHRTLQHTVKP